MDETIRNKILATFDYNPKTGLFIKKKNGKVVGNRHHSGYIRICIGNKQFQAHRLAWLFQYGEEPDGFIDHINGVRDDNRISNLRVVTKQENSKNAKRPCNNSSGVCGVKWQESNKRWIATIGVDYTDVYLGCFENFSDAVNARKNAEVLYGFHENHGRD